MPDNSIFQPDRSQLGTDFLGHRVKFDTETTHAWTVQTLAAEWRMQPKELAWLVHSGAQDFLRPDGAKPIYVVGASRVPPEQVALVYERHYRPYQRRDGDTDYFLTPDCVRWLAEKLGKPIDLDAAPPLDRREEMRRPSRAAPVARPIQISIPAATSELPAPASPASDFRQAAVPVIALERKWARSAAPCGARTLPVNRSVEPLSMRERWQRLYSRVGEEIDRWREHRMPHQARFNAQYENAVIAITNIRYAELTVDEGAKCHNTMALEKLIGPDNTDKLMNLIRPGLDALTLSRLGGERVRR